MQGEEYFQQVNKNFLAYRHYLEKKNEQLRKDNTRRAHNSP